MMLPVRQQTKITGNSLEIGPLKSGEIAELSSLFVATVMALPYYNPLAKTSEISKYAPDHIASAIAHDPEFAIVARVEGILAGFCFSYEDDGLIWLAWFGVQSDYRKLGIGTALLDAAVKRTVKCGSHKIWCDSRTTNVPSRSLLEKFGFHPICTVKNHWYGQDFILWERFVG